MRFLKKILAASLLMSPIVFAAPQVEDFTRALKTAPKEHAELQNEARTEAYQKLFFKSVSTFRSSLIG